jgi:hypothetical protein
MRWIEGLKIWNAKKGGAWCVPRKGSPEHAEVKAIMANAPAKAKVDKLAEMEIAEAQKVTKKVKPRISEKGKQAMATNSEKLTATSKETPVKMEVKVKPRVSEEVKKQIQERKVESKKEKVASFLRKAVQKKRMSKEEQKKKEVVKEEPKKKSMKEEYREEVSELKRIKMLMDLLKEGEKLDPTDIYTNAVSEIKGRYEFTFSIRDGKEYITKLAYNPDDLRTRPSPDNFTAHELQFLQKHRFKLNSQKPSEVSRGESTQKPEEVTKETDIDKVIREVETMPLHDSKNIVIDDTEYVLLSVGNIHTKNRLYTIEKYGKNEKGRSVNVPFTEEEQGILIKKGYTSFGRKNSTASKTILSKK